MDGAPLERAVVTAFSSPPKSFVTSLFSALHGNVCHRFGTLVCGVF